MVTIEVQDYQAYRHVLQKYQLANAYRIALEKNSSTHKNNRWSDLNELPATTQATDLFNLIKLYYDLNLDTALYISISCYQGLYQWQLDILQADYNLFINRVKQDISEGNLKKSESGWEYIQA
jgi:hypothetical protein